MKTMSMMNNASASSIARPVMVKDIAEKLGKSRGCVSFYLAKSNANMQTPTAILIRNTAEEMKYNPAEAKSYAVKTRDGRTTNSWYGGNFKSRQEEIARMQELRAKGYSNAEIAKAIGRSYNAVRNNIGKQDAELTIQNRNMAQHIRAQKNAARKMYAINKSIAQYNEKVEKHNRMKAELNLLQVELLTQKPEIMKASQTQINVPQVDLKVLTPTALQ